MGPLCSILGIVLYNESFEQFILREKTCAFDFLKYSVIQINLLKVQII